MVRRQCPTCLGWGHPSGKDGVICDRCGGSGITDPAGDRPHILSSACWCRPLFERRPGTAGVFVHRDRETWPLRLGPIGDVSPRGGRPAG